MTFTRDSAGWYLAVAGMLIGYFASAEQPPNQWNWHEWTQFGVAIIAYLTGHLQTSPLPSKQDKAFTESGQDRRHES